MIARLTHALTRRVSNDQWIPWSFVAFFGVVVLVNGIMIYVAFSTWTGISDENANSYRQGLTYNDRLAEAEAQHALGWRADASFDSIGLGAGQLRFHLTDDNGTPLTGADVAATILRPTHPGHDFATSMPAGDALGTYSADITFPLPGQWDIRIVAEHPNGTYRLSSRVFVP